MSSIYATEPSTSGCVVLDTTSGPIEIALWCNECYQTTRLFLQLCLDGYYDGMVFHRIVPNFLIQTGAVRRSGANNNDVNFGSNEARAYRSAVNAELAIDRRQYETNSRIRFNHRGQVAMALGATKDDDPSSEELQAQFFITLEEAPYLDAKHVCFGTVSGPTVFNALRIGRTEVDETTNQPLDENATVIKSVKIVDNPIHQGLVPQIASNVPWKQQAAGSQHDDNKRRKKKRKGKFDTNVLSFGDELNDGDDGDMGMERMKMSNTIQKSSEKDKKKKKKKKKDTDHSKRNKQEDEPQQSSPTLPATTENDKATTLPLEEESSSAPSLKTAEAETAATAAIGAKNNDDAEATEEAGAAAVASEAAKRRADGESNNKTTMPSSLVEQRRLKYTKGRNNAGKKKKQREEDTMAKLMAFRNNLRKETAPAGEGPKNSSSKNKVVDNSLAARMARRAQPPPAPRNNNHDDEKSGEIQNYHGQVIDDDDDNDEDWLKTRFKCKRHIDHDVRKASDYEVVDERKRNGGGDTKTRKNKNKNGNRR